MKITRCFIVALPLLAISAAPLLAAPLEGAYTVTVTTGRGALKASVGETACLVLTPTKGVTNLTNSGTMSYGGNVVGAYYVLQANFVGLAYPLILNGHIASGTIGNTTLTELDGSGAIQGVGTFSVTPGCTQ